MIVEEEILKLLDKLAVVESRTLHGYFDHLLIDSDPVRRFRDVEEPFQSTLYNLLIPLFESAAGMRVVDKKAIFITAPKGIGKTSTVAQFVNWLLCYAYAAKRMLRVCCAACDQDQAAILLQRCHAEASHNPWLNIKFNKKGAVGPTGILTVISSDVASSSGALDDVTILDEVSFYKNRNLWNMLLAARAKRPNAILIVITNAGVESSWQHEVWLEAKRNPTWISHDIPAWSASWIDRDTIEHDERLMLPGIFKRLFGNAWVNQLEECQYLTAEQMEACVDPSLKHLHQPVPGAPRRQHFASIDFGSVHDRTVACVLHAEGQEVVLDHMSIWQGSQANPVKIIDVENWIESQIQNFNLTKLVLDPYQLLGTEQKFAARVDVEKFNFGGGGGFKLADNLRSLVIDKRIRIFKGAGRLTLPNGKTEDLVDEVASLFIVERQGGMTYKVDHLPNKHDDRFVALALGALAVVIEAQTVDAGLWLAALNEQPLKEEDMDYLQIKFINTYETWQAIPVVNNEEIKLKDYPKREEAAYAVNVAHHLMGSPEPNAIGTDRLSPDRQKELTEDVTRQLINLRLYPPPPKAAAPPSSSAVPKGPKKSKVTNR